jgi:defect-in-organelle-trafficking protein DotB
VEGAAPIEFLLERIKSPSSSIDQTEIPRDLPSFEAFIRGCWRREPTDIIVGECRDGPTMAASVNAAMAGSALTTTIHVNSVKLTVQRVISLLPADERANLVDALGQSLRLVINQRLVPSADGKRTALREFLVFDAALRRRMQQADPSEWPDLAQRALDGQGQSYPAAIRAALEQGRITEQTAAAELLREES